MKGSTKAVIGIGLTIAGGVAIVETVKYVTAAKLPPGVTPTTLTFINPPATAAPGSTITLTANLLDQNGNAITNYPVTLNEITLKKTTTPVNTDSNGNATFSVTFTATASGNYIFTASVSW